MTTYVSPSVAAVYGVQPGEVLLTSGVGGFTANAAGQAWAGSPEGEANYASTPSVIGGAVDGGAGLQVAIAHPTIHAEGSGMGGGTGIPTTNAAWNDFVNNVIPSLPNNAASAALIYSVENSLMGAGSAPNIAVSGVTQGPTQGVPAGSGAAGSGAAGSGAAGGASDNQLIPGIDNIFVVAGVGLLALYLFSKKKVKLW